MPRGSGPATGLGIGQWAQPENRAGRAESWQPGSGSRTRCLLHRSRHVGQGVTGQESNAANNRQQRLEGCALSFRIHGFLSSVSLTKLLRMPVKSASGCRNECTRSAMCGGYCPQCEHARSQNSVVPLLRSAGKKYRGSLPPSCSSAPMQPLHASVGLFSTPTATQYAERLRVGWNHPGRVSFHIEFDAQPCRGLRRLAGAYNRSWKP